MKKFSKYSKANRIREFSKIEDLVGSPTRARTSNLAVNSRPLYR